MPENEKRQYKVLVADDDHDVLATMTMAIGELGHTVLQAADGLAALSLAEAEDPDIVILDLMLPKRGGFQILQKLKGHPSMKGKRPLVCMVTGNEGMRHKEFAERNGVDEYLLKPFAIGRLLDTVRDFAARLDKGIENAKKK
jgi:DNA-binding response OmpR family regulator